MPLLKGTPSLGMPSSVKTQRGHSLVETLMSVFMVGCIGTVLASAMPVATIGRSKAQFNQTATNFAQKQIEAIRAEGYPNINPAKLTALGLIDSETSVSANTYSCNNTDSAVGDDVPDILPGGQATVTIEQVDLELKRITVNVTWREKGLTRSFRVGTLVANL
jgi:Tfp pilus assembly protein PilV